MPGSACSLNRQDRQRGGSRNKWYQERKSLDNISPRELREELWSCIAALKSTHTMPLEEHELQDILLISWPLKKSWQLCLLCKHLAPMPDFTKYLEVWGSFKWSVSLSSRWTKIPPIDFPPKLSCIIPFFGAIPGVQAHSAVPCVADWRYRFLAF